MALLQSIWKTHSKAELIGSKASGVKIRCPAVHPPSGHSVKYSRQNPEPVRVLEGGRALVPNASVLNLIAKVSMKTVRMRQ
jgi:hypothetical protein